MLLLASLLLVDLLNGYVCWKAPKRIGDQAKLSYSDRYEPRNFSPSDWTSKVIARFQQSHLTDWH